MTVLAKNRKAQYNYEILSKIEAGIVFVGTEVKSCRMHAISMIDAYAKVEGGEVFLYNVHIAPYEQGNRHNHEPKRRRKLLLHKAEIRKLIGQTKEKGFSLIPLSFYLQRRRIKVNLGLCRGKAKVDKRETIKAREAARMMQRLKRR